MIWSIAWKNIWRNRTRSLVIMTAVFLGVFGGIFSSAVMNGATERRIADLIDLETSHIRVSVKEFDDNNELQYTIPHAKTILGNIKAMPEVESACLRLNIQAMAATANANSGVMVYGINPEEYSQVFNYAEFIPDSSGNFFTEDKKNRIVIGDKLAKKLNVRLKSKIVLTFNDAEGNLCTDVYKVAGIFHTSNNILNEYRVFVKNAEIAPVLDMQVNTAHEIFVRISDDADILAVQKTLQGDLPDLQVQTWRETNPSIGMLDGMMQAFMYVFMFIILLAIAFGIVNTMLMVVMERVRELGMLKAIGMKKGRIFRMITLETVFLAFTGGAVGMAFSAVVLVWLGRKGLDLSMIGEGLEASGFASFIYPSVGLDFFFGVSFLIIFVAVLAAIIPALRATKLNPAEAVRVEQ